MRTLLFAATLALSSAAAHAEGWSVALPCEADSLTAAANADRMLVACKDDTARLIETPSGRTLRVFSAGDTPKGAGAPVSTALSPDGRQLAVSFHAGPIAVWSLDDAGPPRVSGGGFYTNLLAFSPDGRLLVANERVLDVASLTPKGALAVDFDAPNDVAFAPDGAAAAANADTTVRRFDGKAWRETARYGGLALEPMTAAFVDRGRTLAVGAADGRVLLLDGRTLTLRGEVAGPPDAYVARLLAGPGHTLLATYRAASGGKPPTWVLIDWSTLKTRLAPGATDASTAAVRGGKLWLFAADGKTLKAWTAPDGP